MLLKLFYRYTQKYHTLLLVLICSILFFTTSFLYVQFALPSGDEPHYLVISQTLIKYHSINVMLDYNHGDYYLFYPKPIAPHVSRSATGQLLPLHSIGGPILWLIPFALFGRLGAMLFMSLVSVLIIVNIYKLLLTMGIRQSYAFLVSLAYAIASSLYIYSHLDFIEPIGALLCIYVFRKILQEEVSVLDLLISSICLGILPWVHIRFALFEMILFFALLYKIYQQNKLKNPKYYIAYLLPVTILFVLLEVYSYKVWGSFNPAINELNDAGTPDKPFAMLPFGGILGTFFDQEFGLLINFPMFMFLLAGVILALKKKFLAYNVLVLLLSIPYILVFTSFTSWSGGWGPPARFMLVLLPLYAFYLAYALQQINNILSNLLFALSMVYGFAYNLLSLKAPRNGFNTGLGRSNTLVYLQTLLHMHTHHLTDYLPSLFLAHQTRLFVAWIGLFVGLSLLLLFSKNLRVKDGKLRWTLNPTTEQTEKRQ